MRPESTTDESTAYARLAALCERGDHPTLAEAARQFLQIYPDHPKGNHLLGFARLCLGDAPGSVAPLRKAAALLPGDAEVQDHLGVALNAQGDFPAAAAAFERAIELDGTRGETWVNAGKNLVDSGRMAQAEAHYRSALRLRPDLANAHCNLSGLLQTTGRAEEALAAADAALALAPDMGIAHLNRGNALRDLGRMDECLQAYDRALMIDPLISPAWNNLADVLLRMGDVPQAVQAAEKALELAPDDLAVKTTAGAVFAIANRRTEAVKLLEDVVRQRPDNAKAWLNLGNMLQSEDGHGYRLDEYRRAMALDPELDVAVSSTLFHSNYLATTTGEELFVLARRFGEILSRRVAPDSDWPNTRDVGRTLRVGLVSGDFSEHPVAFFLEGFLIAAQDKGIEWVAYANILRPDAMTERLRSRFTLWRDIANQPDDAVARMIRADRIDILIDLSGHTTDSRLPVFARKPAPIQATWLGYVGTTGLPTIDYVLGDPWVFPAGEPTWMVETPWLLPECYMSFTPPGFALECGELPMLETGYPTFGCFNNLRKVNDDVLRLWADVLRAVPEARLLLRAKLLGREGTLAHFRQRLEDSGIDLARVEMGGSLPTREDGLREYRRVDIALDPFPYTGMTTSAEALWMGVPVLTLAGDRMMSRVGESLNRAVGLGDWIARDRDDYVQRAARFARDPALLGLLRRNLRHRGAASPLGNPGWFANQFTAALRGMWRQWCDSPDRSRAVR